MKTIHHSDLHDWSQDGPKINSQDRLDAIRHILEDVGPLIVEHKFYMGGRRPEYVIFTDFNEFEQWLDTTAAGDSFWMWDYFDICRDDNAVTHGKAPDERGFVPLKGAY